MRSISLLVKKIIIITVDFWGGAEGQKVKKRREYLGRDKANAKKAVMDELILSAFCQEL